MAVFGLVLGYLVLAFLVVGFMGLLLLTGGIPWILAD